MALYNVILGVIIINTKQAQVNVNSVMICVQNVLVMVLIIAGVVGQAM